jgi:hypothetical protein
MSWPGHLSYIPLPPLLTSYIVLYYILIRSWNTGKARKSMPSEIERYFKKYILPPRGIMYRDINREIDLAHAGKPGGEFLTALGLLNYTELLGKILLENRESYTKQFKAFLRFMGEGYARLIDDREIDIYKLFRSGLVQSYLTNDCDIKMLDDNCPAGIIVGPDGRYVIIVEKYFKDFMDACRKLLDDIKSDEDAYIPPGLE